jgi:ubiquinone/menaquinone biosynthesis C-methylase UbiE
MNSPLAVLQALLPTFHAVEVLDIGCGEGRLVGEIAAAGAHVTGIDPNPSVLERARAMVPGANFVRAGAEALPFRPSSFDVVVVVNALHHVPVDLMDRALAEAARVLRPAGRLVVVEPLAEGTFFDALRSIEDETAVRAAAQAAMRRAVASGILRLEKVMTYIRCEAFPTAVEFLERIVAVDPERGRVVDANRADLCAHVEAVAARARDGKLLLDQPIRVDVFSSAA